MDKGIIDRKRGFFIVFIALLLGFINMKYTFFPNWDDNLYLYEFKKTLVDHDLWETIGIFFLHQNNPTELRTYGLSKVIQLLIYVIFGEYSVKVQMFLIPFLYVLSSILIYLIGKTLRIADNYLKYITIIYIFFPSVYQIRIFHYYSYLCIPFYIYLIYLYCNICFIQKKVKTKRDFCLNIIASIFLIFIMVFTGESLLAFEGITMAILAIYSLLYRKEKVTFIKYLMDGFLLVLYVMVAVLLYHFYAIKLDRFQIREINILNSIRLFAKSVLLGISQFFFISLP